MNITITDDDLRRAHERHRWESKTPDELVAGIAELAKESSCASPGTCGIPGSMAEQEIEPGYYWAQKLEEPRPEIVWVGRATRQVYRTGTAMAGAGHPQSDFEFGPQLVEATYKDGVWDFGDGVQVKYPPTPKIDSVVGITITKEQPCTDCKGSGEYVALYSKRQCPTCDGAGTVSR